MLCPSLVTLLVISIACFSCPAALQPDESRVFTTLEHTALDDGFTRGKVITFAPQTGHQGLLQAAAEAYDTQQGCLVVTHIWDRFFEAWVEYGPAVDNITHGDKLLLSHTCQPTGPAVAAEHLEATTAAPAAAAVASIPCSAARHPADPADDAAGAAGQAHALRKGQQGRAHLPPTLLLAQQQQQQQRQQERQGQQQRQLPPSRLLAQQQRQQQQQQHGVSRPAGSHGSHRPGLANTPTRQEQQALDDSEQLPSTAIPTTKGQIGALPQRRSLLQEAAGSPAPQQEAAPAGRNQTEGPAGEVIQAEHALREALLAGYDQQDFPSAAYGRANVSINLYAHKILQVDLYAGTLRLAVWLAVRWKDPRLAWDPRQYANITKLWFLQEQEATFEIWQPEVALWNSAARMQDTLDLRPMRADSEGNVYWSRNGAVEVACNFEGLSAYPYGPVKCQMEFGSWVYPPAMVDVTPFDGKGYVIGGSLTSLVNAVHVEYNLEGLTAERLTYPYYDCCPDDSNWPVVVYTLTLRRASIIYSLKIMVPQIVLTWVAFSTFWLSPECGERLGLAVTIPLAVAVYDLLVFSSLPTSNRINFVSAMGLLGFLFCVAVLLENALVIQLYYYRESHYMRSWSLLKRTLLAYREQVVWVGVLQVLDRLKLEVAQRQMQRAAPASANWRNLNRRLPRQHSKPTDVSTDSSSAALGGKPHMPGLQSMQSLLSGRMDAAGVADVAVNGPKQSPTAAADQKSSEFPVASPAPAPAPAGPAAITAVAALAQQPSLPSQGPAGVGVLDVGAPMMAPTAVESLLSRQDKEGLQACLLEVLAQTPAGALTVSGSREERAAHSNVQRKLRRAVAVFGMERLVARLHPYITGDASATARQAHAAALHTFCDALAIDYNARWRLLSTAIDAVARWVFTLGYVVAVLAVSLSLTMGSHIV